MDIEKILEKIATLLVEREVMNGPLEADVYVHSEAWNLLLKGAIRLKIQSQIDTSPLFEDIASDLPYYAEATGRIVLSQELDAIVADAIKACEE